MSGINHYKSWSDLKKRLENRLCPQLSGRVSYFLTAYHKVHDSYRRASVRLDGRELVCFTWWYNCVQEIEQGEEYKRTGVWEYEPKELIEKWQENCILSEWDFLEAATEYLNLPIKNALKNENYLIKMFAIMDKRVGKRTLERIKAAGEYGAFPEWLGQFYELRLGADGAQTASQEDSK